MSLNLFMILVLISNIQGFEIISDQNNIIYVIKQQAVDLECQSSKPFYKCQWTRPKSSATCGLFNSNQMTTCPDTLKGTVVEAYRSKVQGHATQNVFFSLLLWVVE